MGLAGYALAAQGGGAAPSNIMNAFEPGDPLMQVRPLSSRNPLPERQPLHARVPPGTMTGLPARRPPCPAPASWGAPSSA